MAAWILLLGIRSGLAGSAMWNQVPGNGDWNSAANWTPGSVPNGPADTATFNTSFRTGVSLSANTELNGVVFSPGSSQHQPRHRFDHQRRGDHEQFQFQHYAEFHRDRQRRIRRPDALHQ
jgi:hypothetical protein